MLKAREKHIELNINNVLSKDSFVMESLFMYLLT